MNQILLLLIDLVKKKIVIDGRNALERDKWRAAGWQFHALGRTD